ncbi:MAG: hypothetical protein NC397_02540 [Clostridium sp.]|nr:hypothetical protein [Clostridium sp.]
MMDIYNDSISKEADVNTVIHDAVMAVKCPAGEFYPNKNYGSKICSGDELNKILAAARQAVCRIDGVIIKSAAGLDDGVELTISVNDAERKVRISL